MSAAPPERRPRWPGELLAVAILLVGYDRIADLAQLHVAAANSRGYALLSTERLLHVAIEPGLVAAVAPHRHLGQLLAGYYDLAHSLVTVGVLAGLYVCRPLAYRRARRALFGVNLAALGVFVVLPVTPPRLLPAAGFADIVARSGTWGAWSTGSGVAAHANQLACLPSLHVAWAVWVLCVLWSTTDRRVLRCAAAGHVLATVAVVLGTGNHYLVDVVAGGALTVTVWRATRGGREPGARTGVRPPQQAEPVRSGG